MRVLETSLPGLALLQAEVRRDARGHFLETWHDERYRAAGIPGPFVQDNVSVSGRGVLRGMHFQWPHPQGKLVTVLQGEIFDVALDLRRGSPTFGRWEGVVLTADGGRQLWIPDGFAHGFLALEDSVVAYKCTERYHPQSERSLRWDDPDVGIEWPRTPTLVSERDAAAPALRDLPPGLLPCAAT